MHFQDQEQTEQPIAPKSTEFDYLRPSSFYWMSWNCNIACKQDQLNSRDRRGDKPSSENTNPEETTEIHSSVAPQLPPLSNPAKTSQKAPPEKALISVEDLCY